MLQSYDTSAFLSLTHSRLLWYLFFFSLHWTRKHQTLYKAREILTLFKSSRSHSLLSWHGSHQQFFTDNLTPTTIGAIKLFYLPASLYWAWENFNRYKIRTTNLQNFNRISSLVRFSASVATVATVQPPEGSPRAGSSKPNRGDVYLFEYPGCSVSAWSGFQWDSNSQLSVVKPETTTRVAHVAMLRKSSKANDLHSSRPARQKSYNRPFLLQLV